MTLFLMYWRRTLRKPGSILMWLALPFVFMTIYSLAFGGDNEISRTTLAVIDRDQSLASGLIKGAFQQDQLSELITIIDVADEDGLADAFAGEKASAGLIIPEGFGADIIGGKDATLTLYTNPRHFIGPQIAEGVVSALATMGNGALGVFAQPLQIISAGVESNTTPTVTEVGELARMIYTIGSNAGGLTSITSIGVTTVEEEEEDGLGSFNMAALFFPGLLMFGLLTVSLNLETRFLHDRINKVTHRFVTAPVRPFNIVLQQRLYTSSFLYVVAIVSGLLAGVIWQIPPMGLWTANLLAIAMILFITGINGTIFSMSNSLRAVSAISSFVMMTLLLLGGGFFPAEFTPESFQALSRVFPTGMANMGLTAALTGRDPQTSMTLLFLYSGAFFVLSLVLARKRLV